MEEAVIDIGADGKGLFSYSGENGRLAEMLFTVRGDVLTVSHTEVNPVAAGHGLAKGLLETMVAYARAHKLTVNPLCPFVSAQFRRHPELYADLWDRK